MVPLAFLVIYVVQQGSKAFSWEFLTTNPPFSDRLPGYIAKHDATHGVQFFDFDRDGDLDLMVADNLQYGSNFLFRNRLGAGADPNVGRAAAFQQTGDLLINEFVFTAIEVNFCQ